MPLYPGSGVGGFLGGNLPNPTTAGGNTLVKNADVDPAAAITKSRLAALGIVDADVAAGAAIVPTKLGQANQSRAKIGADVSVPNAAFTSISFTASDFNIPTAMWSAGTNPTRISLQTTGLYLIEGAIPWAAAAGGSLRSARILLDGAYVIAQTNAPFNATYKTWCQVTTLLRLTNTDWLELQGYQDSGGALNIAGSTDTCHLAVTWLTP